ncbi:hypothetical protein B0H16DRAFT_1741461 [Mycena metata]|uniref:Uncharacterized protein n=1 Tax=Mycena metata TaxID=1033252 RepID=A0AAD7HAV2_9AGAR|nr:hypothetical protein B0H16DRAFT_1741461 [Mycena metata]
MQVSAGPQTATRKLLRFSRSFPLILSTKRKVLEFLSSRQFIPPRSCATFSFSHLAFFSSFLPKSVPTFLQDSDPSNRYLELDTSICGLLTFAKHQVHSNRYYLGPSSFSAPHRPPRLPAR